MSFPRVVFFSSIALIALTLGALVALPGYQKGVVPILLDETPVAAEVARDPYTQAIGLSGRSGLARFAGMLFVFEEPDYYGIWMKGMRFPIDILWIKDGVVVDLEETVLPPADGVSDWALPVYRPDVKADFVLEVNAGFSKAHNIAIGSSAKFSLDHVFGGKAEEAMMPGSQYFIENLREERGSGRNFKIEGILTKTSSYKKYRVSYMSDDLLISGIMNVPNGAEKKKLPILILNHGLIPADIYFSGRGSKREQDFFAARGYITIHPDYRGLASSSPNPEHHHDFYVGYTRDVLNLISALKKTDIPFFDLDRIGMWGHSMGGGIAARVMVLGPDIKAFVLFASISANAKDNFYELPHEEVEWLNRTYGSGLEAEEIYRKISPLTYFEDITAAVQLHHGTADDVVPISFSEKMRKRLKNLGKKVEYYVYPGQKHEFIEDWPFAAERSLQFFDRYVKNAK